MRGLFLLFFAISTCACVAQVKDLVRLGYSEKDIRSRQIGLAASPDGNFIAFAFEDKILRIYDVAVGKFVKRLQGPFNELFDVHLTADKKLVLIGKNTATATHELQIWNWKDDKVLLTYKLPYEPTKTAFSPANNVLAIGQYEGNTSVFDLSTIKHVRDILYKKHHVSALAIHPKQRTIVIGVMAAMNSLLPLKLFSLETGAELATSSKKDFFTMAAFTHDGQRLIAWGREGNQVFDANALGHIQKLGSDGVQYAGRNMAYGAEVANGKVMMLTDTRAFNVSDLLSGARLFTSVREEIPRAIGKIGIGSPSIYRLNASAGRVIINTTGNNVNQIYDATINAMIGYFFADSNDDFAIVARDGRYDGTAAALSKLFWTSRKSDRKTMLESTGEQRLTPRLFSSIIGENSNNEVEFDIDNVVTRIPSVRLKSIDAKKINDSLAFESGQKFIKLQIEVGEQPQEVNAITLFQNSKPVKTIQNVNQSIYTFDVALNQSFGEYNYFFATASSKSGIDSEKLKFKVLYKGASDAKPRLFLVTIGINQYKNPKYNLNYAEADADGVSRLVTEKSKALFANVIPFSIRNDSAVKTNILKVMEEIRGQALEQDILIWYYAGHGVMSEGIGREKEFFIVPHDITQLYGKDELLFEKAISASDLKNITRQINAQKQIFILDACQSSGALEAFESRSRGVAEEKAIAQLARSTGTFWITSTGTDQFASEFEKLGHGLFTYVMLEGIGGAADTNKDKQLTIRELSTYIENKVPELSEQLKGNPQFPSAYSFGNDFPFILYK